MTMRLPGAWRIPGCAESRSRACGQRRCGRLGSERSPRSEEHTSELQSPCNLVCRLLLEKKKKNLTNDLEYGQLERRPLVMVLITVLFSRVSIGDVLTVHYDVWCNNIAPCSHQRDTLHVS